MKRVVITSSFASIVDMDKGTRLDYMYTTEEWNPVTYAKASNRLTEGSVAYCASKVFAEKAAFEFVEKNKPNFTVSNICPPMVYGPVLHR
jgi:nucleoside-diphosphate-sugar epimerase